MKEFLMIALGALVFIVIFQIAKASEYVSVLKGENNTRKQNNKINAFFLLGFLVFGLRVLFSPFKTLTYSLAFAI